MDTAKNNTRILVFDLDGTLTESKQPLKPEMGAVIAQLLEKMPVAVFSGAALHQFEKQFLPFLPKSARLENLYLFPTSAAQCYAYKEDEWKPLYKNDFTSEEKEKITAALEAGIKETHIVDDTQSFGERIEDRGAQITFSALGQQAPIALKETWDPDKKKRTPLWELLTKRISGFHIAMNAATSIDITHEGINKAYGIKRLSEISAIPIDAMLYIGDALFPGGNDEIVKESGVSVRRVAGPEETATIIREFLDDSSSEKS